MADKRCFRLPALVFALAAVLVCGGGQTVEAAEKKPAVLFTSGLHRQYFLLPMRAEGIELDTCGISELPDRLKTGKYNVVVPTGGFEDPKIVTALKAFMAEGGGVLVVYGHTGGWSTVEAWKARQTFLEEQGAHYLWVNIKEGDPSRNVKSSYYLGLYYTEDISPPFGQGVKGLLYHPLHHNAGTPAVPLEIDDEWTPAVRGSDTAEAVPAKEELNPVMRDYVPEKPVTSPVLLAVRKVGQGRLAAFGIAPEWSFAAWGNSPPVEDMMTRGAGGRPSHWVRVLANTFRWLAEPSLKAGMGGAVTPEALLNPPVRIWELQQPKDWSKEPTVQQIPDQLQTRGLIGARTALSSGTGTVADYVKAAKAAGLQYVVFLEDSLKMDQAKWDQLTQECAASSDGTCQAIPGLTYEDAQGDHLYAFSDNVKFPKPEMLLEDKRLATNRSNRTGAYFDYDNEYMMQQAIRGFWNHRGNMLSVADYKLFNSFPIYSFLDGRQIDDALGEYLYQQGLGGCQAPLAFEIMTEPRQVARRAAEGWTVVCHRNLTDLPTKWYQGAWSFSGSGSQYITNGPQILVWQSPNRLCDPRGEWWRPDIWQYRLQLRVASDAGLKTVTLYDGDRQVLRRWQPQGEKVFERELVLANCQQLGLTLVVEDAKGRRAISAAFWSRNCINEEFFCSDRCNFLGNSRLRTRTGVAHWTQVSFRNSMGLTPSKGVLMLDAAPAVHLTPNSPALPFDGAPSGYPTYTLDFYPRIPGELDNLFAYPQTYLVSPEIGIGQADIVLAYDPMEQGKNAKVTPLGHPYEQPQRGFGNSWGSWHRLVPSQKVEGWGRIYAATWLTEGFRLGAFEANLRVKNGIDVPEKGLYVTTAKGELWKDGQKIGSYDTPTLTGAFDRGVFATLEDPGGAVVVIGTGDNLMYEYNKGLLIIYYQPKKALLIPGETVQYTVMFAGAGGATTTDEMLHFARQFGILAPGAPGYEPQMSLGSTEDTYFLWRAKAAYGAGVAARIAQTAMPGFLTACVEGLNDNWSVYLLDRARPAPNVRALPVRDGRAWGQLDLNVSDSDLYIGHPVVAFDPEVRLLVNWQQEGQWFIEAHNPTSRPITTTLKSPVAWTPFAFRETVTLAPGESRVWTAAEKSKL